MQIKQRQQRKTKIICTIGPSSSSLSALKNLYKAGMDIARLNMSHGEHKKHLEVIKSIKLLNKTIDPPVPILVDTKGPEIRTGDIDQNIILNVGDIIDISMIGEKDPEETSGIFVDYNLKKDLNPGNRIIVDNGLINLDVIEKTGFGLRCKVVDGGVIKSRRHINLPGIRINLPAITSKDEQDILFAVKHDVDFIALSFVRSAADVEECKRIIKRHNGHAQVIAKIEDHFGVLHQEEIIKVADGLMVARGDLGVEVPIEELPIIQRRLIKETAEQGKKCIIATHLLESMIDNPIPTRAEVTDVANAVYEEADCVMLSGETSIGKYPVKAVEYLHKICKRTEISGGIEWAREKRTTNNTKERITKAAVELADAEKASAIILVTKQGLTADFVTSFHPKYSVVYAFTNVLTVRKKLLMNRACYSFYIEFSNDPEKTIQNAFQLIKKKKLLKTGDTTVVLSDILAEKDKFDSIQVRFFR